MLKRFSRYIEENLEKLENNIALLKKKFPGKVPETLEPDSSLSKIRDVEIILKEDTAHVETKCRSGELGSELALRATEVKNNINNILDTLRGKISQHTIADRFDGYGGKITSFLLSLFSLVSKTAKVFLAAVFVIIFSFVYLSLTMESEDSFLKNIKKDFSYIEKQKDMLEKQRQEYNKISEKIKSFDQAEMGREDLDRMVKSIHKGKKK